MLFMTSRGGLIDFSHIHHTWYPLYSAQFFVTYTYQKQKDSTKWTHCTAQDRFGGRTADTAESPQAQRLPGRDVFSYKKRKLFFLTLESKKWP
mgnify:CR=1 FL=1